MNEFSLKQINHYILKKNHLLNDSKSNNILQITEDIVGLHATGTIEPFLSLFVRMPNFNKEDLEKELYIKKTLGRIRGIRKTLFIHTKKMIPIIYSATKHLIEKLFEKYLDYRGISLEDYKKLTIEILKLVNQKERSTSEIKKILNSQKDIAAVISVMCDEMLLIRTKPIKTWRDRRIRYASFKTYFPDINLNQYSEEEALLLLIKHYLKSYGPSTENDIIWWTGINKSKVRSTLDQIKNEINHIKILKHNFKYIALKSDVNKINYLELDEINTINFLPQLDPYLMAYKDRERYIDTEYYVYVFDRSGNVTSTILLDGRIIGVWDIIQKPEPIIKTFIFKKIDEKLLNIIYKKATQMGEFITKKKIQVKECDQMSPLNKRTAGGFMSPLKYCN